MANRARSLGLCAAFGLALGLTSSAASAQEYLEELIPAPGSNHKSFADKLAVDGDTLVMGDFNYIREDVPPQDICRFPEHGAIRIYKKVGANWQEAQFFRYIDALDDQQKLGSSVAIKGNVIVAATPGKRSGNLLRAGALAIYKRPSASEPFAAPVLLYSPAPEAQDQLGGLADVVTNGVYAVANSQNHKNLLRVFQVQPTPTYLTTITFPGDAWPEGQSMFITSQNILVADSGFNRAPYAWKLNGSQATPIDTSGLASLFEMTLGDLTGDGDTVAWIARDNFANHGLLKVAKFDANGALYSTYQPLPPQHQAASAPLTLEEGQGLFFKTTSDYGTFLSAYKFSNDGMYRYQGILTDWMIGSYDSLAFNGTDIMIGDRSQVNPDTTGCGDKLGSIFVFRPIPPTAPGPGLSTTLRPWMHSPVYGNGRAVATSGSYAVSAAPDTYQASPTSGGVFLYQNVNGAWQPVEEFIDGWNGFSGAWTGFGYAADLNPDFLMIGVPWGLSSYGLSTGGVQYSRQIGGTFTSGPYLQQIEPPNPEIDGQHFGFGVALSGNTLFVGSPAMGIPPGAPYAGGSVFVYTWDANINNWVYRDRLQNQTIQAYENFGTRVAAAGDYLIVGIPGRSSLGRIANGSVQIFRKNTQGIYESAGEFLPPFELGDYSNFGDAVSIGTDFAAAGSAAGAVVVYRRSGTSWSQAPGMPIKPGQFGFGSSVAIEGGNLVVGSPWENRVHRYVRVVTFGISRWLRAGTLIGSTSAFGSSVDLTGGLVAIGEPYAPLAGYGPGVSYVTNLLDIR